MSMVVFREHNSQCTLLFPLPFFLSLKFLLQQMATTGLVLKGDSLYTLYLSLRTKGTFFCFPRATACSPANHESVIELVPGPLAGASAARQTDPEQRLGECEVHTTSELLTCISFSQALKGTSEKESSCLTGPESPSLCRMQTRQMPMSSFLSL